MLQRATSVSRERPRKLCVTPAAVSQQIKTLETYLGVGLFVRHQKGLQLTEAGLAMHPKNPRRPGLLLGRHRKPPGKMANWR